MQGYIKINNNIFETYIDNDGKEKLKLTSAQMRILAMLYSLNSSVKYRVKEVNEEVYVPVRKPEIPYPVKITIDYIYQLIDWFW